MEGGERHEVGPQKKKVSDRAGLTVEEKKQRSPIRRTRSEGVCVFHG